MWTRSELKAKAKNAFNANYWKSVLVAILLAALVGTSGASVGGRAAAGGASNTMGESYDEGMTLTVEDELDHEIAELGPEAVQELEEGLADIAPVLIVIVGGLVLVVLAAAFTIKVLLINPLEVGGRRFFVRNLNQQAPVREIAYAYDHGYRNVMKTLFLRDIKTIGWTLLFVIPGIVKHYEYLMIPYLLGENASLSPEDAFARSRELMNGNKWHAFVLDLSFIGWDIVSAITMGLAGIFFVNPYREQTRAALYEALAYGDGMPDFEALPEA